MGWYEDRMKAWNEINTSLENARKNFDEAKKIHEENSKKIDELNLALDELLK